MQILVKTLNAEFIENKSNSNFKINHFGAYLPTHSYLPVKIKNKTLSLSTERGI